MRKTSVYLNDEEAEGLRALARATGRSQAELIREGVRRLLRKPPKRTFHSLAQGASGDSPRWSAEELAARRLGRQTGG
jgi:Arc/MetJ-type ribon-helix-helix transcriptional regulator